METWPSALDTTMDEVWRRLTRGVADRRAPARHPTLATVSASGQAEARTVVLRRACRDTAVVEFHTDRQSTKVAELTQVPDATLHVWEPKPRLQIRLRVQTDLRMGPVVQEVWARVPERSRSGYGPVPAPGTPIPEPTDFSITPDKERFVVVHCEITQIETLWLGDTGHRRALFERATEWSGQWLVP